jgi:hypothetical protein
VLKASCWRRLQCGWGSSESAKKQQSAGVMPLCCLVCSLSNCRTVLKQFVGYDGECKGTVQDVDTAVDAGGTVLDGLFFRVL